MDDNQTNSRSPNEADLTKDDYRSPTEADKSKGRSLKKRNYETLTINFKERKAPLMEGTTKGYNKTHSKNGGTK